MTSTQKPEWKRHEMAEAHWNSLVGDCVRSLLSLKKDCGAELWFVETVVANFDDPTTLKVGDVCRHMLAGKLRALGGPKGSPNA